MRLDDASRFLSNLRELTSRSSQHEFLHLEQVLEASILALREEFAEARRVLLRLPTLGSDSLSATLVRYVDWRLNDHRNATAPDGVDYLTFPVGAKAICRIVNLCISGAIAFDRLQFALCDALASEALQLACARYGSRSPMASLAVTLVAQVAYEQGRLDEAEALLRPRFVSIRASGMPVCIARASVILARLSLHAGQQSVALSVLRDVEALGRTRRWRSLVSASSSEQQRILAAIRPGQREYPALRIRGSLNVAANYVESARGGHWADDSQSMSARTRPPTYDLLQHLLRDVCSTALSGRTEQSYRTLICCLRIGAIHGLRMIFADAGRVMPVVLEHLYHTLPKDDPALADLRPYIVTLLRTAAPHENPAPSCTTVYRALSQREAGVLRMIARGMSNKHIAHALGITPETVKSHAKNIFVKLATCTRAQAVARADALGLLY